MRTPPLRRRVTIATISILAAAIITLDVFVYLITQSRLESDLRHRLAERAEVAARIYNASGPLTPPGAIAQTASGGGIAVMISDGMVYHSGLALDSLGEVGPIPATYNERQLQTALGRVKDARVYRAIIAGRQGVVVTSGETTQRVLSRLLLAGSIGSVVTLLCAALALMRTLRLTLRPLTELAGVARRITAGDLGQRVHPSNPATELGVVGSAFDEMLDSLEDALRETRLAAETMQRFLADASHELRTPLAGLRANVELLLRDRGAEGFDETLLKIGREATRASRLVDDFLSISRIEQGVELQRSRVDLYELARLEVERAADAAPALTFELSGDAPCFVDGDTFRLRQVLANLLDNAHHATPAGGRVSVSLAQVPDRIVLEIEDDGPGVPPADRERIFERFVRLDPSRSRDRFGSGLGLPIARGLAEAHGGSLACVDGTRGARLRLTLPAAPAEEPADPPRASPALLSVKPAG